MNNNRYGRERKQDASVILLQENDDWIISNNFIIHDFSKGENIVRCGNILYVYFQEGEYHDEACAHG
jgi:hypothetical protein